MSSRVLQGPAFKYPVDKCPLGHFFFKQAEKYKNQICHIDGTADKTETYGSFKSRSTRVAMVLQKKGITSNDVIAICSVNTLDNTVPMVAACYLGAKVANLDPSLSVRHTKHLVSLITPKMIFVEEFAINLIEESLVGTTFETEIVVFGKSNKYSVFADLLKSQENEEDFRPVDVDLNETAVMYFSSGTTGLPKAICHSHRSFMYSILQFYQLGMSSTMFHFTTFYWMTAMMEFGTCFKSGGTRVFARNPSAEDVFKIIEKYEVSFIFIAPVLTYKLTSFENAHNYNTSSLKQIVCGGTPMAASQLQKMKNVFPSAFVTLGCGMSEMAVVACFDPNLDVELANNKIDSCGLVGPGVQLKIVDPETEEILGCNQKGEIRLKAPSMMVGYYRADFSQVFDKEGFLKSGDVGYFDEDECLYVIERIKEMFKYQSWHVVPSTIEGVLLEHPNIKEAVVFGIPSTEDGEVPAACVVLKGEADLSEEDIDDFLKSKVADRERLRGGVTFVDALPRTPSGKVVRKEVRDWVIKSKK